MKTAAKLALSVIAFLLTVSVLIGAAVASTCGFNPVC